MIQIFTTTRDFKISKITPIPKNDKSNIENYSSISQTSNAITAFKQLIKKELDNYLENQNLVVCT